jgi:Spy/CpxP family protein refolding chaperone
MRLHSVVACTAALVFAVSTAFAQTPPAGRGPGGQGPSERRMAMLLKDITLTPAQQARIDSIGVRYQGQMPAFTPGTPPDSATREKMRDLFRRHNEEIRAVLTPDQQKVWDRNLAEMRARRGERP